jgi:acetyl esterase/lipase
LRQTLKSRVVTNLKIMKSRKLLLLFATSFYLNVFAQPTPTFTNVDYSGNNDIFQKMDIYIPPGLTAPAPVIVFIHGGGWATGTKGAFNVPYFEPSYNAGFICVDINYRLTANNHRWPKQIEDCKGAIRFLKANAATYGIDKCRFGVMGSSAGGHLAAMMGTSADVAALEGTYLGNNAESSRIQAVVDLLRYGYNL